MRRQKRKRKMFSHTATIPLLKAMATISALYDLGLKWAVYSDPLKQPGQVSLIISSDKGNLAAGIMENLKEYPLNDRDVNAFLPRSATRYFATDTSWSDARDQFQAAERLGLKWLAWEDMGVLKLYLFWDNAGMANFLDGLYGG